MTQKEKIINYMQKNGFITTRDAGIRLNIWDLQSNIRDLKNDGIEIKSEWITNKKTKTNYKVYALKIKEIENYKRKLIGRV